MQEVRYCVRGCTRLRRHLSDCADRDACRGCEPRLADHGNLCWPCHRRFELMLGDCGHVYDWLSANLAAGQGAAPTSDFVTGKSIAGSPAPIKVAIYDVRQHLTDSLAEYVDELCEVERLRGPDRHTAQRDSSYLLNMVDRLERLEWVGDWWEHLAELMSQAHALAPWRPEMRRCHGIPCPECEECALVIFGGEQDVTCLRCRTIIQPERYGIWVRVLLDEQMISTQEAAS